MLPHALVLLARGEAFSGYGAQTHAVGVDARLAVGVVRVEAETAVVAHEEAGHDLVGAVFEVCAESLEVGFFRGGEHGVDGRGRRVRHGEEFARGVGDGEFFCGAGAGGFAGEWARGGY